MAKRSLEIAVTPGASRYADLCCCPNRWSHPSVSRPWRYIPKGARSALRHRAEKLALLRMEFRIICSAMIALLGQIVRGARRLVYSRNRTAARAGSDFIP